LVIALLVLGLLFVVASSFTRLNLSENQIATSDRDMILALNAAEAGVHQAIKDIKERAAPGNLAGFLPSSGSGCWGPAPLLPCPDPNGEQYTFTIASDPAGLPCTVNAYCFAKITSRGTIRSATRTIETVLYVPNFQFPSAVHLPGTEADSIFQWASSPGNFRGVVDGNDTDPTTGNRTGNQKLGVSASSRSLTNQSSTDQIFNAMTNPQRDTPVFTGRPGDYASAGYPALSLGADTTLDSDRVQQVAELWGSFAPLANILNLPNSGRGDAEFSGTRTYANGCQGGPNATGARASQAWGCPSSPGIFYIKGISMAQYNAEVQRTGGDPALRTLQSGNVTFSGNFQGAGILILNGADLLISDDFRWEGIILVTGPLVGIGMWGNGTQQIFGAVVVNERGKDPCGAGFPGDCNELGLLGTAAIKYSQTAINRAFGGLAPRYAYWNERAQ
jgi:hypothetical protein